MLGVARLHLQRVREYRGHAHVGDLPTSGRGHSVRGDDSRNPFHQVREYLRALQLSDS